MSKLDQIRAVGSCEMARRFGAPTPRSLGQPYQVSRVDRRHL